MCTVWMWDFEVHDVIGVIGYQPPREKEAKPRGPNFQILFLINFLAKSDCCKRFFSSSFFSQWQLQNSVHYVYLPIP